MSPWKGWRRSAFGYAIGGLSVGELKEDMLRTLDHLAHKMPEDRPVT